ncbi:MAG: Uma2 family endonuclease [Solirubrobacteraceae bacterium]
METAEGLITAEEFLAREDRMSPREELIDGRIVRSQPDLPHQTIAGRIYLALANWTNEARGRGVVWLPIDVVIDQRNVLVPDLAWVSEEKVPPPTTRLLPVSPDLAVEVRSPSTWHRDIRVKRPLRAPRRP